MTDKELIIDGVDVSGCEFYNKDDKTCREVNGKYDTDICDFDKCKNSDCYYKQLARKEQECEELKKWKENVINLFNKTCRCKYLNEENAHCSFYNKECIAINQCLYKNQQTLAKIKEIAEKEVKYAPDGETFARPEIKQILQKISEVGNE